MAKVKKENKVIETWEQKRERELNSFINDRTEFIPEPTYIFNIGDRVTIGALEDVYIVETLLDGKVYEIKYSSTDTNYGNPIKHENQRRFVSWLDVRPFTEDKSKLLIKNSDLNLQYSQRGMTDILSKAYYYGIDFEPDYQRDYVWELEDKVALIDSIYNNIDIGKFVFIHKGYGGKYTYEILDGKQRIRAVLDFYENRFQYKGKYFNDLSLREQDHLENYPISTAEVKDISKEQILRYFVKLNKHGKVMDKAQIEKVEKMIEEISK